MNAIRVICFLPLIGCALALPVGSSTAQDAKPSIDYQRDIRPILSENCFKCHGPDEGARQADLRLDRAEDAAAVLESSNDEPPEIIHRITSSDPEERMPPADSKLHLTSAQIEMIRRWLEQGGIYSVHWSLRPIARLEPPNIGDGLWRQNEIDRFVLAKLNENGLAPSPPATKNELLRRLAFDLTGLPPSLEELEQFLNDQSQDAYERMVDHYLNLPAYGERMAFNWMEVARYADSYGYQVDKDRIVWQWRDWAIEAFNENLPYDQFVIEQLAGDLLPEATDRQILATAFNRLHPQKSEGGSISEEFRNEYVADRVQTFATAFMGMTLECARCHNHKFDPITQREYYQLYAFFNNIDEFGLHSYFTDAVPTPTLLLADDVAKQKIAALKAAVVQAEADCAAVPAQRREAFANWLKWKTNDGSQGPIPGRIALLDFETPPAEPNRSVPGVHGSAVELTGDDLIQLSVGNFRRYEPFSVAAWVKTPDYKERAVIFHRSAAWTDAGSRGYELLIEEGHLSAALVHFWPGNALRIRGVSPLPIDAWTHIVMTYDGSSTAGGLALYVDGQLAQSEIVRDALTKEITGGGGDNIAIGARFRDSGFKFGCVDDFQVFDRQLSPLEAQQLFDGKAIIEAFSKDAENASKEVTDTLFDFYLANVDEVAHAKRFALRLAREQLVDFLEPIPEIMVMREMPERRPTHILRRGAYDAPTDVVDLGTPEVLPPFAENFPRNRLGLAKWLVDPAHPLTARVAVNRIWELMFGQGLVRSPEDFGSQGTPPSHPELLDWLASDFVVHGWDTKRLIKQMVLSATYRQSSWPSEPAATIDPANVWLSRANRRRLDAEMLRDQVLFASGLLDRQVGGPSVKPYEMAQAFNPQAPDEAHGLYRRSLYTYWKRMSPPPVMVTLDAVRREICTVKHERTSTPLQAIVLLNDPQRIEAARVMAENGLMESTIDPGGAIATIFCRLTSREPRADELQVLVDLFQHQSEYYAAQPEQAKQLLAVGKRPLAGDLEPSSVAAMTIVASTIMNLDACLTRR